MLELPSEVELSRALGVPVALALSARPCPLDALGALERERLRGLWGERRTSWLRGRAAWKSLLRRFGEDPDTARQALPGRFSLTHAADLSLAAGLPGPSAGGLGVDLELGAGPREEIARFFLDPPEQQAPEPEPAKQSGRLLALWTIKEAVFKADRSNHGRSLIEYRLVERRRDGPCARVGRARAPHGAEFRYACFQIPRGSLAVAVDSSSSGHRAVVAAEPSTHPRRC